MTWYDDPAKDYRQRYRLPEHWVMPENQPWTVDYEGYLQAVLGLVPAAAGRILDAGCGDGFLSARLVEKGWQVTGADYSDRAIAFARLMVPSADFHCLDLRDLPDRTEWHAAFACAVSVEVIEHIPPENQERVLAGLVGTLQPGGRLIISVPSTALRGSYTHYKHFTLPEITALVEGAGLRIDQVVHQNRLSPLLSRRLWKLLTNNVYDLVWLRRRLRAYWLRRYNLAQPGQRAGRFLLSCTRPTD